jgi:hypothetical protein
MGENQAGCGDRSPHCGDQSEQTLSTLAGSSSDSRNACGEESAGRGCEASVQLSSVKQEPNTSSPLVG